MSQKTKERLRSSLFKRVLEQRPSEALAEVATVVEDRTANRENYANDRNIQDEVPTDASGGDSALLRKKSLGLKAAPATTQRPYRLLARQLDGVKRILRSVNRQLPEDVPDVTMDELGRIIHELLLEQKDPRETVLRLRGKASSNHPVN